MPTKLNPAQRRYLTRLFPLMIAYVAVIAFENILFHGMELPHLALYALAIAPALPIVGIIAVMGLYLAEETDEYLRIQHAKATLLATGITLSVATAYGFMEDFRLVPHLPAYWAFVVFCAGLGLARGVIKMSDR